MRTWLPLGAALLALAGPVRASAFELTEFAASVKGAYWALVSARDQRAEGRELWLWWIVSLVAAGHPSDPGWARSSSAKRFTPSRMTTFPTTQRWLQSGLVGGS